MKTYSVTMHRIAQHTFTVQADTPEEAAHLANDEARINGVLETGFANWETIGIEEVET